MLDVPFIDIRIGGKKFIYPVRVLGNLLIAADIFSGKDIVLQKFHLTLQACRKDCKSHNFDQADVLLLDVMELCMRMVNAERMLIGCDIVAQSQIKLIEIPAFSGDRGDRAVWSSVCLSKDEGIFIGVAAPFIQDVLGEIYDALCVRALKADHGERPFYDPCGYILISLNRKVLDDRSLCHGKGIVSALEMIVA